LPPPSGRGVGVRGAFSPRTVGERGGWGEGKTFSRRQGYRRAPRTSRLPRTPSLAGTKVSRCSIVKNEEEQLPPVDQARRAVRRGHRPGPPARRIGKQKSRPAHGAARFSLPRNRSFSARTQPSPGVNATGGTLREEPDDRLDEENRDKPAPALRQLAGQIRSLLDEGALPARSRAQTRSRWSITFRLFRNDPASGWRLPHPRADPACRSAEAGGRSEFAGVVVPHTATTDPALRKRKLQRDLRLL